ncbi:MAG: uracil-DNA glycosylase [Candidatus Dormibacteria bacterium]
MHSSPAPTPAAGAPSLTQLHRRILACRRCAEAGWLQDPVPVLAAPRRSRLVLVGQAPGRVEGRAGRPFSGRAGRILFRWLEQAGLGGEEEARRRVYITSLTKCFPGPGAGGSGDRRPSAEEVALCRPHLDAQLTLLDPWLVLAVGQMAVERFLGPQPMSACVGRVFPEAAPGGAAARRPGRPLILPLPHPSGASRWLNLPQHQELLAQALATLGRLARTGPAGPGG